MSLAVSNFRLKEAIDFARESGADGFLAVGGGPDVVPEALLIAEVVVFNATQNPYATLEDHRAGGDSRAPSGILRHLLPMDPIRR